MRKLKDLVIYRSDDWYSTFPCLTRTADGALLCGFRRAPLEPAGHSHLHSMSRAVAVASHDDGESWDATPLEICPEDELGQQDPQLMTTASGRIVASFFRWQAHANNEADSIADLYLHKDSKGCTWSNAGVGVCHSDDNGLTWSGLRRVKFPWARRGGASRSPAIQLPGGRLLLTCYGPTPDRGEMTASYLMASDDDGLTWSFLSTIHNGNLDSPPRASHEPRTIRAANGELLCFIRAYVDGGRMLLTRSQDDGATWSPAETTDVWGYPQAALVLPDGRIVLAYGYRREPRGVRARLLAPDAGDVNTAPELVIRDDGASNDLGYPTLALRRDGTVLCAYYIHHEDETRYIAASVLAVD